MSGKLTMRDQQIINGQTAESLKQLAETQASILGVLNRLAGGGSAPAPSQGAATPTAAQKYVSESEAHGRAAEIVNTVNAENELEPLPEDQPDRPGPCFPANTLRNQHGIFPKSKRRFNGQTKRLDVVNYDVSPANRSAFMAEASGRQFGVAVTLAVPDGKSGEKTVQYPAVCALSAKQYSSYDHGLFGQVDSVNVTLPDGSEYVLTGQVTLRLVKRIN